MKKSLLIALALFLVPALQLAIADMPSYTVENNVILMDLDGDNKAEQIELTGENIAGESYVTLNVSKQNVLKSHRSLLTCPVDSQTQIKIYPLRVGGSNLLYIETHATGAESLYSMWMIVGYQNDEIVYKALMYDPGWTSGVGLYDGNDPVDCETYLVYSADYASYSEQNYLNVLKSKFSVYGLGFMFSSLPFSGWYSAATLMPAQNQSCALDVNFKQLPKQRTNISSGSSQTATSGSYTVSVTDNLHLRAGAGTDFANLGVIKKGTVVTYLGESEIDYRGVAWHYVNTDLGVGWISSKYSQNALIDPLVPESFGGKAEATASLHVRTLPDRNAISLGAITKGTKLESLRKISVDDRGVAWFKVKYNNYEAWVSSKYSKLR